MKKGIVLPLNSMMYCPDCGAKMKLNGHSKKKDGSVNYFYVCGTYSRCFAELKVMTQKVYQDKPEELCLETLSHFRTEEAELTEKVKSLTATLEQDSKAKDDVEEFIRRLKQYADAPELTREMSIDLIEYIVIGDRPADKSIPRNIQIYYKFLDNGLSDGEKPEFK
ncbi:MAG: DUF4368 domain-containing protein [Clostridium sp.]|nr:DUF4368 domain-containing protein [Clostridium sp.]